MSLDKDFVNMEEKLLEKTTSSLTAIRTVDVGVIIRPSVSTI